MFYFWIRYCKYVDAKLVLITNEEVTTVDNVSVVYEICPIKYSQWIFSVNFKFMWLKSITQLFIPFDYGLMTDRYFKLIKQMRFCILHNSYILINCVKDNFKPYNYYWLWRSYWCVRFDDWKWLVMYHQSNWNQSVRNG